jgi:hypothetical protein
MSLRSTSFPIKYLVIYERFFLGLSCLIFKLVVRDNLKTQILLGF